MLQSCWAFVFFWWCGTHTESARNAPFLPCRAGGTPHPAGAGVAACHGLLGLLVWLVSVMAMRCSGDIVLMLRFLGTPASTFKLVVACCSHRLCCGACSSRACFTEIGTVRFCPL